jgi:hypothetical protein
MAIFTQEELDKLAKAKKDRETEDKALAAAQRDLDKISKERNVTEDGVYLNENGWENHR